MEARVQKVPGRLFRTRPRPDGLRKSELQCVGSTSYSLGCGEATVIVPSFTLRRPGQYVAGFVRISRSRTRCGQLPSRVRKNCFGPVILSAAKNPSIWNQANAEILRRLRLLRMTSAGIFTLTASALSGCTLCGGCAQ